MAGNTWTPNATAVIGQEWQPTLAGSDVVASDADALAWRLVSKAAETITDLRLLLAAFTAPTAGLRPYAVDIYPAGSEVAAGAACNRFAPNATANIVSTTYTAGGSVLAAVDDASASATCDAPVVTDGVWATASHATASSFDLEFATAAFALTRRVTRVQVQARVGQAANVVIEMVRVSDGAVFALGSMPTPYAAAMYDRTVDLGERNPATGLPWTPADIRGFDNATYRLRVRPTGILNGAVDWVSLNVDSVNETRAAVALAPTVPSSGVDWPVWRVRTDTGVLEADTWAKLNATTYTFVARRWRMVGDAASVNYGAGGSLSVGWLDEAGESRVPTQVGRVPAVVAAAGGLISSVEAVGSETNGDKQYASQLRLGAGTVVVDSQPYSTVVSRRVVVGEIHGQELSGSATTDYRRVRAVVRGIDGVLPPGADLLVKVRNRATTAQVGPTLTVTPADFAAMTPIGLPAAGWRQLDLVFPAVVPLVAGTQYLLEFSSTGAQAVGQNGSNGTGWNVAALLSVDGAWVGGEPASYEGTTNLAAYNGADQAGSDLAAVLSTIPATLAGLGVTEQSLAVAASGCSVDGVPFARVDWGSSALAGSFLRYEVERSVDGQVTWEQVATISTEAASVFDDYEAPLSTALHYRARAVRTDLATGLWATTGPLTITVDAPALYFSSNLAGVDSLGYIEQASRGFDFGEAKSVTIETAYGREGYLVFRDPTWRGEQFRRTLTVHSRPSCGHPRVLLLGPFQPLRDLAAADLPYLCVRASEGDVWYASVVVPTGEVVNPGDVHLVEVQVVTVARAAASAAL